MKLNRFVQGIFFLSFFVFIVATINAQATTFPVDQAGIAAYTKLDSINSTQLTQALTHFYSLNKTNGTYVIGTKEIVNVYDPKTYPHLYIGLDGWIVAYYLKTEESSRIMQWNGYTTGTINSTTLKDAIDMMCADIGVTYSTPIKYYDFKFPDANKMTLIADSTFSSYSLTIPGTLYESSYSAPVGVGGHSITVDNTLAFSSDAQRYLIYGYYNSTLLTTEVPHLVSISGARDNAANGAATVLIYKN